MNYSPFIYAFEAANIAITGAGTLDGQADARQLVGVDRAARRGTGCRTRRPRARG